MAEEWALVALGSNLGDAAGTLRQAAAALIVLTESPLRISSLWRTAPVDCPPDSPPFLNAAVALRPLPNETPQTLLAKLQALERRFGRQANTVRNAPRPLDLDLIAFGPRQETSPVLTLPHPRASQRLFVLAPLAEVAPEFVLPGQTKTIAELLRELPPGQDAQRLGPLT
jgi:2-amino-4-hydroxy-6-hydroxymethyldihydropteridine diphosphokinase